MPASSAAADRAAQTLSRPFTLRGLTVPNRIVMAPMTRDFSPGGVPGADVARYYARRAAGGVGLIVTEGTYIRHDAAGDSVRAPLFHGEDALTGWKNVVAEVHRADGRILAQICHVGVQRPEGAGPFPDAPTVSPSGLGLDGAPAGKAMTQDDLDAVIAAFAEAAAAAERTGFDGVELHGAHGLLIDQFLWERTNRRTDGYGGDPVARTRFAAEIVAACRKAVSADFPIVFRTSQWKVKHYAARLATTPQELEAVLTPIAEAGVDAFHSSTRRYWVPEFEGSDLNLAGWTKKLTGKATISVGSVGLDKVFEPGFQSGSRTGVADIEKLLDRLERDEFDLIAIGRALIADPEWARKVLTGDTEALIPFAADQVATLR
ncbi:NADH:flavin oxidoreductase [Streptomyces rapamycinicus]|uniref:12-oxophytodienoate reductase n=2 Tax=Streptomyces rapamycinicus TaxID=1226757 RepID=A0A0A0NW38_STRRN|nr:NADH:flavin oxidoreductase [Streptomyces rapamycinicus]AGP59415.1 12-oxophytodienoate reductase [Streptomyces rapamycinicus NRRL 5491]MBB4787169.1 2,4-dienoyl-CoA reductase-like NADH-dependent reductase (Old Yellow Enzyme family) [Streptomyces rapamycinicus]RLV77392.1 12-oxophytodienoate reductase [Streptomyces rapamycinicus NRRL 5491]UTO67135.1 NADH:flavin oxidoreductase [Streptomyces rapamycinicus]UTP35092.1 NADH:flavin oxidoreductase [Streptomyces rapamycinicus NRRL 5491]